MKEYPSKNIGNKMIDVCECGHQWCWHESSEEKPCERCTCPNYKYEQTMTIDESNKLDMMIRNKNEDNGFTI